MKAQISASLFFFTPFPLVIFPSQIIKLSTKAELIADFIKIITYLMCVVMFTVQVM